MYTYLYFSWNEHVVVWNSLVHPRENLILPAANWQVITAQYFVWFFCLLPLVLPWSNMKLNWKGLSCIILWVGAQLHWLMWGYLLEFKGKNVFLQLWIASILFLAANSYLLISVIHNHRYSPVFTQLDSTNDDTRKLKWWSKPICWRVYVGFQFLTFSSG